MIFRTETRENLSGGAFDAMKGGKGVKEADNKKL